MDLSTTERRVKALLNSLDFFQQEMKNKQYFVKRLWWYRIVDKHFSTIKISVYGFCVLLNLNILFSNEQLKSPYAILYLCPDEEKMDNGDCRIPSHLYRSFMITAILGMLNFCGYFIIVGFIALTEIPLVVAQTQKICTQAINEKLPMTQRRNYKPFGPAFVFFVFVIFFWQIHAANFDSNPSIYRAMIALSFIWFCKCIRELIVVPDTIPLQIFTITYDVLITKPFLRNHVCLQVVSFLGFRDNKWFSIMLFDVFNNSTVLQDIIRSITSPAPKLAMILYTMIITAIVFTMFGFREFGAEEFNIEEMADDEGYTCHSTFSCFMLVFSKGTAEGSISPFLREVTIKDGAVYWERTFYDLAFFVWMGVLLFNIVAGLMLDTFGKLREEANQREDLLSNSCYICGITRASCKGLLILTPIVKYIHYIISVLMSI